MRKYVLSIAAGCLCGMLSAQQTYTLQTCLQEGLEKNYAIRISKNEQQIAANNVTAANAGRLPSLDLAAGYSGALSENRTESAEGERGSVSGVYDQTVNAGLDLGWTLFDGFRVQTNYKRLEELRGLGEVNARIAIEDFVAGLTAEYYNYVQQTPYIFYWFLEIYRFCKAKVFLFRKTSRKTVFFPSFRTSNPVMTRNCGFIWINRITERETRFGSGRI